MKIETRFEIGDVVYCIVASKVVTRIVNGIKIKMHDYYVKPAVRYCFEGEDRDVTLEEERCFRTKEELVNSL